MRERIKQVLDQAQNPVVLCDLTPKSMELVRITREIRDVPVLVFKDFRDVLDEVKGWTVFYYRPAHIEITNDEVAAYYGVKGKPVAVKTQIEKGDKCGLDQWKTGLQPNYGWDVTLTAGEELDETFTNPFNAVFDEPISTKMCFNCFKGNYCYCPKVKSTIYGLKKGE